jgi:hypothetical protein
MRGQLAAIAILITFVVAAEQLVGWRTLIYPWFVIEDPLLIVAAVLLLSLTYVIRALRIYRYFRLQSGFGSCLRVLVQHTLLVNILPMRAGEFAFPALMKRYFGMPVHRSLPALLWLRALDLHVLLCIPILVVAMTWDSRTSRIAMVVAVVWVMLLALVFLSSRALASLMIGRDSKFFRLGCCVLAAVPASPRSLLDDWLLTMANWILKLAVFAWIIHMFSSQSYLPSLAGAIGGEVSSMLPIQGFAGFGTYEAGVVAAMRTLGVTTNDALTGAMNLHLFVLGVSTCAALMALLLPVTATDERGKRAALPSIP